MDEEMKWEEWHDKYCVRYCDNDIEKMDIVIDMLNSKMDMIKNDMLKNKLKERIEIVTNIQRHYEELKKTCMEGYEPKTGGKKRKSKKSKKSKKH
jgi:hypothetical protein